MKVQAGWAGSRRPLLVLLALLLLLWSLTAPPLRAACPWYLAVRPVAAARDQGPYLAWRYTPGTPFSIPYTHSVTGTPVVEVYQADEQGRLYVEESRFRQLGAGLGQVDQEGRWVEEDGWHRILGLHRPVPRLILWVGALGRPGLQMGGRQVLLAEVAPEGHRVEIRVERRCAGESRR